MKTLVQFGAGNIGRSLVGYLFAQLGYRIVFVETNPTLVAAINTRGRYTVEIREEPLERHTIEPVEAVSSDDQARVTELVAEADLLATAVGAPYLPDLFPVFKAGLERRTAPVNILICENVKHAAQVVEDGLRGLGFQDFARVGLVDSSIEKMVPNVPEAARQEDVLLTWGERYSTIHVNRGRIRGDFPVCDAIVPVDDLSAYYERKLCVANLAHTLSSVLGYLNGFPYIADALYVEAIRAFVHAAADEACRAVEQQSPSLFAAQSREAYIAQFLRRLANRMLQDTVYRGGRHIERKLKPGERLVGPTRLFQQHFQAAPPHLAKAIAAAFYFQAPDEQGAVYPQDRDFQARLQQEGIERVLPAVCDIAPDEPLGQMIMAAFRKGRDNFNAEHLSIT
jgi:mannitol-1-phosphate 5-dehydrogenase